MAAPTMTRAPPRLPQPSCSDISAQPPSPPRPVSDAGAPKNPWRINSAAAVAVAPAAITLIGEPPSSWPPLSSAQSHRRSSDSPPLPPPPEIHDGTLDPTPADRDPSSSSEIGSREEMPPTPPMTTTTEDTPASSPPPSVQAPLLPRLSPGNAAAVEHVRSPRRPVSPQRRGGRGQRWNHQRGVGGGPGGGGGQRNHYGNHRPPAHGWRPNWNVNAAPPPPPPPPPPPLYPPWGFYPGSAVGVVPPAELNQYYVPYPQPYGEFVYADYNGEPYAAYYDHATYEMPYVPSSLNPEISTGVPPPMVAPNVYVNQADTLKENVLNQIEYYFSEDNLVKDLYLRQQMDGDGWVDINKIASFRKVAALTDNTNLIRDALMPSNIVELQGNKMRRRHDWERWVLQQ